MAKDEFDIFHRSKIYPKADQIFVTTLPNIDSVMNDCVFVLDTNALLVPFSTGSESLGEITKIFFELKRKNQLKVPEQVAREFADNRPTKIGEMFNALSQKRDESKDINIGSYPLLETLDEYLEILSIEKQLKDLTKKYSNAINKLTNVIENWSWDDPVSLIYRTLFTPEIIHKLDIDQAKVKEEWGYRCLHKIPPGYKDGAKEDGGIGDFLIWLAILDIGKAKQNVVFVSGDVKSDWYHKSRKNPLYPRFELLTEFGDISDNHSFHMIRLSDLLKLMGAKDEVVAKVKMEENIGQQKFERPFSTIAAGAVYNSYKAKFGSFSLRTNDSYDFTYFDENGKETAVIVISHVKEYNSAQSYIHQELIRIANSEFPLEIFSVDIIIVSPTYDFDFAGIIFYIHEVMPRLNLKFSVKFYLGYVDFQEEFINTNTIAVFAKK